MLKAVKTVALAATVLASQSGFTMTATQDLKQRILDLAKSYEGQGDADQSKQRTLEPLVEELVRLNPMPPIRERIPVLAGTWKQVWGPYEYRNDNGGIDNTLGIFEIYQVVSADGYYYNVAPYYPDGDRSREQIGLLRGEYVLDPNDANGLRVQFTRYPGVDPRPANMQIWELAPLAEAGTLQNEVTIVPTWVVRLFFGGGKLEEVYTDQDMRIVFGSSDKRNSRRSIYVMTRVQ